MELLKLLTKDKLLEVPINKIVLSKWDVRKYPEREEEYNALMQSIQQDGLLNPLTVMNLNNGTYLLVAGRRRLKASIELGLKSVPVYVKSETSEDWENDLVTVVENLHRRELKDYERAYGILHAYTIAGYTKEEALSGTKYLHNPHKSSLAATTANDHTTKKSQKAFKPDNKFVQVCKTIAYRPNYQYQLLQLTRDIPEKTLEKADLAGLSTTKKIQLTHTKLREHPEVQEHLVNELARKQSEGIATEQIRQAVSDLETGYIKPSESKKSYTIDEDADRDVIKGNKREAKQPQDHYMAVKASCNKLLFALTGRALTKGEHQYNKEIIYYTKNHRLNIVKSLDSDYRSLNSFKQTYLDLVKLAVDDMLKILNEEMDTAEQKQEMMKK